MCILFYATSQRRNGTLALCNLTDCSPPGSSVHGILSGLPFPSPGDLPDPGIKLMPLSIDRCFVLFCFYHWATGEAPPSYQALMPTPNTRTHHPGVNTPVSEQHGHRSHNRLWTENGVGVITMLSPFCGATLHPDPNSIPGNPLEDVCILLLTHFPVWVYESFQDHKGQSSCPQNRWPSISVSGTMPPVPSRPRPCSRTRCWP